MTRATGMEGPTGKFPDGKIHPDDEGELRLSVGHSRGLVVVNFGKGVHWLGLPKREALDLAELLRAEALP